MASDLHPDDPTKKKRKRSLIERILPPWRPQDKGGDRKDRIREQQEQRKRQEDLRNKQMVMDKQAGADLQSSRKKRAEYLQKEYQKQSLILDRLEKEKRPLVVRKELENNGRDVQNAAARALLMPQAQHDQKGPTATEKELQDVNASIRQHRNIRDATSKIQKEPGSKYAEIKKKLDKSPEGIKNALERKEENKKEVQRDRQQQMDQEERARQDARYDAEKDNVSKKTERTKELAAVRKDGIDQENAEARQKRGELAYNQAVYKEHQEPGFDVRLKADEKYTKEELSGVAQVRDTVRQRGIDAIIGAAALAKPRKSLWERFSDRLTTKHEKELYAHARKIRAEFDRLAEINGWSEQWEKIVVHDYQRLEQAHARQFKHDLWLAKKALDRGDKMHYLIFRVRADRIVKAWEWQKQQFRDEVDRLRMAQMDLFIDTKRISASVPPWRRAKARLCFERIVYL